MSAYEYIKHKVSLFCSYRYIQEAYIETAICW